MGKTLFAKIFSVTVLIIFASTLLTSVLLFTQLGNYLVENQNSELAAMAEHIAEVTGYVMYDADDITMFNFYIDNQSRNESCAIIIMDADGTVVISAGGQGYLDKENVIKIDERYLDRALEGESVSEIIPQRKQGGYITDSLIALEPVRVQNAGDESIWGVVAVCKPMPQIRQARNALLNMFIAAQAAAILLAFLVSYVVARRISRPISKLNAAAKAVAGGDFTKKINYEPYGELGELIASFNYMTDALKEIDDLRSSFVSNVSHELRTPMTIISGFVEGILDGTIAEEDRTKYLSIVLSETQRLSRLVSDLLETGRLESGKVKLVMKPFDINALLRKGIISYEQAITDKKIDVEAEFMYDRMFVSGAEDSIYRVVMNLLDNAIKFTPEGGIIRIKSIVRGQKVEVSVENTGEGINEKDIARIWERFYKTDKSRGVDKRGVGLGLYLVKTIINQHGNRIWAESKEGEYTRFTFALDKVNVK